MYLECKGFVHVWVPRLLVPEQKTVRVQICTELQQRLSDEGDSFLNKVITCDETWFHFFEPENKQQSSMWKHTWSPSPVKARLSKSVGKVMSIIFCDTKGIVLNHIVPDKTIVMVTTIPVYFENNSEELSEISAQNCTGQDSFYTKITIQHMSVVL